MEHSAELIVTILLVIVTLANVIEDEFNTHALRKIALTLALRRNRREQRNQENNDQ